MHKEMKERVKTLTPRHREIMRLISLGCTTPEIAEILGLQPSTVDNHRARLMARLGVDNMATLTRVAVLYKISSLTDKLTRTESRRSGRKSIV